MPKSILSLNNFTGGEISPKLDARIDQKNYSASMRTCLNMIPYKTGAITRRPGTQHVAKTKLTNTGTHSYGSRLVQFTFSPTTTFVLEFGNEYVRFYTSAGAQAVVTAAQLPAWDASLAYVAGTFVADSSVSYYCILSIAAGTNPAPAADPTHWVAQTILEQFTPYNADSGSGGSQPGSIYGTDIWSLSFCQINDVVYITSPSFPVYSLTRFSNVHWVMAQVDFLAPALLDQNATDTQIAASAVSGTGVTLTVSAPAWVTVTYYNIGNSVEVSSVIYTCVVAHVSGATFLGDLHAGKWEETDIFNTNHIGSTWQLAYLRSSAFLEVSGTAASGLSNGTSGTIQALGAWEVHTYGVWSSDIEIQRSLDGGQTWDSVRTVSSRSDRNVDISGRAVQLGLYRVVITNSAALVNAGATNPRVVFECVDSFLYGLVKITAVASAISATADVVAELANTSATSYWSEAAWSDYRGFPQAVCAFQQRVWYASSGFEPQRIWGTVTNDIQNFALGDQTLATDAVVFDLNAPSRGPIQWLIGQTDLFAGFSGAEWVINSGSTSGSNSAGNAITPTAVSAVEHSTWGSAAKVAPAIVGDALVFTQRQSTSIRQMLFSIYTNKYMSQDLTPLADHLFTSGVAQLCYMTRWRKQSIIWAITQQGTLCGMTYELDQEVFAWHRHNTGIGQVDANGVAILPDNGWESVCVIDGVGTQDDQVWLVGNRLISGVQTRYIERMNPANWEEVFTAAPTTPGPVLAQAFYVDCGTTVTAPGTTALTGFSYLEGRYVVGLADGQAFGPVLVASGVVQLPGGFTSAVALVQVGLPISYAAQPMRIDLDPRAGNTQGLIKQLSDIYVRVNNAMGGSISNGTTRYPLWVSATVYAASVNVISPITQTAFVSLIATAGTTDPSAAPTDWAATPTPVFNFPVPIPYTALSANPFAAPSLITVPTDILMTPQPMPWPVNDPVFIVSGNDALPITVLALITPYEITSVP